MTTKTIFMKSLSFLCHVEVLQLSKQLLSLFFFILKTNATLDLFQEGLRIIFQILCYLWDYNKMPI